jgi:hypothetical protein
MQIVKLVNGDCCSLFCVLGEYVSLGSNHSGDNFIHTEPEVQNNMEMKWKASQVISWRRKLSDGVEGDRLVHELWLLLLLVVSNP